MADTEPIVVTNNVAASRFEVKLGALMAIAEYELGPKTITFTHARVPAEFSGRGIAAHLIEAGLSLARERGLGVIPQCRYVAAYMRRHPEVQDLLTTEGRTWLAAGTSDHGTGH